MKDPLIHLIHSVLSELLHPLFVVYPPPREPRGNAARHGCMYGSALGLSIGEIHSASPAHVVEPRLRPQYAHLETPHDAITCSPIFRRTEI